MVAMVAIVGALVASGTVAGAAWLDALPAASAFAGPGPVDPGETTGAGGPGAVPVSMLAIYQAAATACAGLSWTTLAAIGTVESDNDQSALPGVHSGHNFAGAEGPMQFEPSTFVRFDLPVPPGGVSPPSPYDPVDSAFAAARLLCSDGAAQPQQLPRALYAYNHSVAYVDAVLQQAKRLQAAPSTPTGPAGVAVSFALAQLGTPYRWGGETPGVGFDCSGLVQAAWATAGVHLPRVAQQQFASGPLLAPGTLLQPGDLVFFGPSGGGVTHVGMVVDAAGAMPIGQMPDGEMVDAPHTGAFVRLEPFPLTVGAGWGGDIYLGATRPEGE